MNKQSFYSTDVYPSDSKWDTRFMKLAREISTWSKDPSTKIGVIVVDEDRRILSQGYNGFPRGVYDYENRYSDREEKYKYVVHGELNAILNAAYNGISLKGSTLYVYGLPVCRECAKAIIQSGIKRVVVNEGKYPLPWAESWKDTMQMFRERKIEVARVDIRESMDS